MTLNPSEYRLFTPDELIHAAHVFGSNPTFVVEWKSRLILACNNAVREIFQVDCKSLVGETTESLYPSRKQFESFVEHSERILAEQDTYTAVLTLCRRDGDSFPADVLVQLVKNEEQDPTAAITTIRDLSEAPSRHFLKSDLKTSYRLMDIPLPAAYFQHVRTAEGRRFYNTLGGRLLEEQELDLSKAKAKGEHLLERLVPLDEELYQKEMKKAEQELSVVDMEIQYLDRDDRIQWGHLVSQPQKLDDGSILWNTVVLDISRQKEIEDQAHWLATHDRLTGLRNRLEFHEELDHAIHKNGDQVMAVVELQVRRMRLLNLAEGEATGDELLRQIAQRLKSIVAENDILARSYGDIFLILITDLAAFQDEKGLVGKLLPLCREPYPLRDNLLMNVDLAMGLALHPQDGATAVELLQAAGLAAKRVHDQPEKVYDFFSPQTAGEVKAQFKMEKGLRKAIADRSISPYYQPVIALKDGALIAFEALARWQIGEGDFVSPGEFIPLAEKTGLIVPLGELILEQVANDMRQWRDNGKIAPSVHINCSALQISGEFVDKFHGKILGDHTDPHVVVLELTESAMVENFPNVNAFMTGMRSKGVRFALDDFGTGYSSLHHLGRLPFSSLKIDKSFIDDITTDNHQLAIVRGVILMSHSLGIETIAEGVETSEQLNILRELGCHAVQGFYYSAALPPEKAEEWLTD